MDHTAERAYILAHFQEYRIIQPTVVFLHGLPTALSHKKTLSAELQPLGKVIRINIQNAGKDFFTAFVQFDRQIPAALGILSLDGKHLMNRTLRVFYGSTKFCPHFLKGHQCLLSDCNYAHYFHSALTHLKENAKEIDHRNIAAMFLAQDRKKTQMAISSMNEGLLTRKFILPIEAGSFSKMLNIGQGLIANCTAQQQEECETSSHPVGDVQQQWCIISQQIQSQVRHHDEPQQKALRRSKIQQFLDGAQRFLSKLIFQSSDFIF